MDKLRSKQVTVHVLLSGDLKDFTNPGCTRLMRCDSNVISEVFIATEQVNDNCKGNSFGNVGDIVTADFPGSKIPATRVYSEETGTIYISETVLEFRDLCSACCS